MSKRKKKREEELERAKAEEAASRDDGAGVPEQQADGAAAQNGADEAAPPTPEEEAEAWRDKYMRVLAELDNYRKRQERDRVQMRQYAVEGLARDLLPVLDALEMAQDAQGGADAIRAGVAIAIKDALRVLGDKGVERIPAEGEAFDPRFHEAAGAAPATEEHPPGTIVTELRTGYRLNDRVLRASRVHIAMAAPKPPEPAEPDAQNDGDSDGEPAAEE